MRQILLNGNGAFVARVPAAAIQRGRVLVRVHYSLISIGTEIASLRSPEPSTSPVQIAERAVLRAQVARAYLAAAIRDPRKATRRMRRIAAGVLERFRPAPTVEPAPDGAAAEGSSRSELEDQGWSAGYSAAGEVVAVGEGITDLGPGDLVACAGAGYANHAELVSVPRNLACRVPRGCSLDAAATATVGSIALQGVRRAAPQLGDRVVVLGLGLIGQITAQLLRANGCTVLGLDLDPARVERARRLGLAAGTSSSEDLKRLVADGTAGYGADCTIITAATKSDVVINLAMEVTRAKGKVVIVGDVGLNVQRPVFYRKEIDLLMSTSYGPGRYDRAYEEEGHDYPFGHVRWTLNRNMQAYLELLSAGRVTVAPLIDKVTPVDEAPAIYKELAQVAAGAPLGVLIQYAPAVAPPDGSAVPPADDLHRISIRGHNKAGEGSIRYALVGVGGFGTSMLVPQLAGLGGRFALRVVVSRDAARGGNFARAQGVEVLASDLAAVLEDPSLDLVVIATRHHEHASQVIASLSAGKHVFVEKPLAISWDDLSRVADAYESLTSPPVLLVGFNRRFSPAILKLFSCLQDRRSPVVMNYRVHAGYLARDHWVQQPQGGGRNLGEACHMYDVFRAIARSAVTQVSASSIVPGGLPYLRNDNFSATLTYEDGSLGTLVYTALGPAQGLPKERLEVFADGTAYVLDDFKTLTRAGDAAPLWEAAVADKGHAEELRRLGEAIANGQPSPIPFAELLESSAVALTVEDLLHGRA